MSCCLTCEPKNINSCFNQITYENIDCGTTVDIWGSELINPSGTVIVVVQKSCAAGLNLLINGDAVNTNPLVEGETFAYTIDPLETVEIECLGVGDRGCIVKVSLSVNYEVC